MLVRSLSDIEGTSADVEGGNWKSRRLLLAGDGIKISKEAEKMPAVKRLHQESDNSGKAPYIYGHHWGVIGILSGWVKKTLLCTPLRRVA